MFYLFGRIATTSPTPSAALRLGCCPQASLYGCKIVKGKGARLALQLFITGDYCGGGLVAVAAMQYAMVGCRHGDRCLL